MIISEIDHPWLTWHISMGRGHRDRAEPCCDAAGPGTLVAYSVGAPGSLPRVSTAMTWEFSHATVGSRD
jgi:hypothetical protein